MNNLIFQLKNETGSPVTIEIKENCVLIRKKKLEKTIPFDEIVGVWAPQANNKKFECEFIYTKTTESKYGKCDIPTLKNKNFITFPLFAENEESVKSFQSRVMERYYSLDSNNFKPRTDPGSNFTYYKKALILVNPHAGNKKGMKIFGDFQRVLEANGVLIDHVICKPLDFTSELIRTMPFEKISSYDMIICISGDGIPHEVINGYMKRQDIDFSKHPLTISLLPAGSGCCLTENTSKLTSHHNNFNNSLYNICHFCRHPLKLQKYECLKSDGSIDVVWGFLNLLYGYFADVDIESEFLRVFSHFRFDIYGAWKYLVMKKYNIQVDLPKNKETSLPSINTEIELNEAIHKFDGDAFSFYSTALPYMSRNYLGSPTLKNVSGFFEVQIFPVSSGRGKFLKYLLNHPEHKSDNNYGLIEMTVKEFRLTICPKDNIRNVDIDGETYKRLNIQKIQASISNFHFFSLI
jgi:diacylglycerol kinase family enzyme